MSEIDDARAAKSERTRQARQEQEVIDALSDIVRHSTAREQEQSEHNLRRRVALAGRRR